MALPEVVHWEVKEIPLLKVIGKSVRPHFPDIQGPNNPLPVFWDQCFADGTMGVLDGMVEQQWDPGYVGWMGEWDDTSQTFLYMVGMLMHPDAPVPAGFVDRVVEPCQAFVAWVHGPESSVYMATHPLTEQAMKEQGYSYDNAAGWSMELYNCPRFTEPDANGEIIIDYYLPCRKA